MEQTSIAVIIALLAILVTIYLSNTSTSSVAIDSNTNNKQKKSNPHATTTKSKLNSDDDRNKAHVSDEKITKTSSKNSGSNWKPDRSPRLKSLLDQTRSGCDIPVIDSKDDIDQIQRMINQNIPFVVKGFAKDWPATSSWAKSSLLQKFGDRVIKQDSETSIVHNSGGVSQGITFKKYLEQLETIQDNEGKKQQQQQSDYFVFDTEILQAIPELGEDVIIPSFLSEWDNTENESNKSMWHMLSIGPSKSGLPLHSHGKTWISLVYGSKKWFLYPPGYNLPDTVGQECHALCTVSQWIEQFYPKLKTLPHVLDVSMTAKEKKLTGETLSNDDYVKIFTEVYGYNNSHPSDDENDNHYFKPLECKQEAGDLVYLPDQWLHLTFNLGETIGYGGQSALMAQQRLDQAKDVLQRSPDDFNLLRDLALGASHLLIDHSSKVRTYGQYFDNMFKVLVFDTLQKTKEFAKLTEDPVILFEIGSTVHQADDVEDEVKISGKSVLSLINSVVFSEDMHRFDTIVILSKGFSPKPQKKSTVSNLASLQTKEIGLQDIKLHLYHVDEQSSKSCPLQLNAQGDAIDDNAVLSCLVSSLKVLMGELGVEDSTLLGDEKGGSSKYTRATYKLVKETLQRALEKRSSSLEAWRLLAEVSGMVGDYAGMETAIIEANNIYDEILKKNVDQGVLVSRKSAAAIYHQLATSFMAVEMGKSALPLLEKTLHLAPEYGPAWIDRIVAAGMARNRTMAVEKLAELKQRFPKHPAIPQLTKYVKQLVGSGKYNMEY